ncbi:putative biopolymer transport protein ExbB [Waddlia chondrophila 2032/99]|uniref:Putative biopolymer transport protein ExbB n=2 Tax=Waddlia chondrophila TaxID=71667 RepID=D6YTW5_WADCW|nr:MotA/TolQ/ExbB proton channel family protein [Waddlia chondrophila]ADI37576.1 putative biopolymer transport protein ExbB [Waddlia chondrophila WSU 86-1044]CCB91757.1 putative biopolymer transport protein ExbB [Waddlia chondrophila 2032/99]
MAINEYLATIFHYNSNWNIILILIGFCSIVSFTIFIERLMHLKRSEIDTNSFILQLRKHINDGDVIEAIHTCEKTKGTISNIVKAGLAKHNRSKEEIENSMEIAGMIEIAQLEKNAKILSIIAHIAPLVGLLGTVLGFIQAFAEMRMSGLVDISANRIGEAMEYALVTTAAGLVVAIPSVLAYNYVVSRIEGFILEIQTSSSEIVDLLVYQKEY